MIRSVGKLRLVAMCVASASAAVVAQDQPAEAISGAFSPSSYETKRIAWRPEELPLRIAAARWLCAEGEYELALATLPATSETTDNDLAVVSGNSADVIRACIGRCEVVGDQRVGVVLGRVERPMAGFWGGNQYVAKKQAVRPSGGSCEAARPVARQRLR